MKDRIENEVVRAGEVERNVKLGRGGIREIEFIVQTLQLLHSGRQPFLQGAQTLAGLEKLAQYELLSAEEARLLGQAYSFLRNVEHRLQMEDNRQTHVIPTDRAAQEREERTVLEAYLPKPLTDEEIGAMIEEAIAATGASGPGDFGKVMGLVMGKARGRVDGRVVQERVRGRLGT